MKSKLENEYTALWLRVSLCEHCIHYLAYTTRLNFAPDSLTKKNRFLDGIFGLADLSWPLSLVDDVQVPDPLDEAEQKVLPELLLGSGGLLAVQEAAGHVCTPTTCRLRRRSPQEYIKNFCWKAGVTFLS
jgi:hypothetical protein